MQNFAVLVVDQPLCWKESDSVRKNWYGNISDETRDRFSVITISWIALRRSRTQMWGGKWSLLRARGNWPKSPNKITEKPPNHRLDIRGWWRSTLVKRAIQRIIDSLSIQRIVDSLSIQRIIDSLSMEKYRIVAQDRWNSGECKSLTEAQKR